MENIKILVADDEEDLLDTYQTIFESKNYKTFLARNGQECLEIYRRELQKTSDPNYPPFDIVVLDHKMPKKSGLDVAKEILELVPNQRVIFASAFAKDILVQAATELNLGVELLQKPFNLDSLIDKIEDKEVYSKLQEYGIEKTQTRKIRHDDLVKLENMLAVIEKEYL